MRAHHIKLLRIAAFGLAFAVALVLGAPAGHANEQVKTQIAKKAQQAMENFDLFEFDEAKKLLNEAILLAKKNGLDEDPFMAGIHVRLGIVYMSGLKDIENAKLSFINAVSLDPNVQIDASYKTGEMEQLLDSARAEYGTGGGTGGDSGGGVSCSDVTAITHTLVESATAGVDRKIDAYVSPNIDPARVGLHYRPEGSEDFVEAKMEKIGECRYVGTIPGDQIAGSFLHYYVAAYNKGGKKIASKGSSGSPNIIEVAAAGSDGSDTENPLGTGGGSGQNSSGSGGTVTKGPTEPGPTKPSKVFLSIALGSGGAYVTGQTEQERNDVACCFAPALFHLFPELGYYLSPQMSLSFAFRMGFPIGANLQGHATAAPSGLLRFRYSLAKSGDGLQISGALGGGVIRQTVKLTDGVEGMDTDTTVTGPLLLGGGAGYIKGLGGPLKFVAELNALAGLPVISELGSCEDETMLSGCVRPNFALQFDLNVGVLFAF